MSEIDDLKAATERSRQQQMHKELDAYIVRLLNRMNVEVRRDHYASAILLAGWSMWVLLDIVFPWGRGMWVLLYIATLIYSHYTSTKLYRTFSELDGVFNTLKILGMMSDLPEHPTKKRRWVMDELVEAVRSWAEKATKEKAKGLAPA